MYSAKFSFTDENVAKAFDQHLAATLRLAENAGRVTGFVMVTNTIEHGTHARSVSSDDPQMLAEIAGFHLAEGDPRISLGFYE